MFSHCEAFPLNKRILLQNFSPHNHLSTAQFEFQCITFCHNSNFNESLFVTCLLCIAYHRILRNARNNFPLHSMGHHTANEDCFVTMKNGNRIEYWIIQNNLSFGFTRNTFAVTIGFLVSDFLGTPSFFCLYYLNRKSPCFSPDLVEISGFIRWQKHSLIGMCDLCKYLIKSFYLRPQ